MRPRTGVFEQIDAFQVVFCTIAGNTSTLMTVVALVRLEQCRFTAAATSIGVWFSEAETDSVTEGLPLK